MHTHRTLYRNISIALILALIVLFAASITIRVRQAERNLDVLNNFQLNSSVILAIDSLSTPAVIEPHTSQQFLPSAKLVLPAEKEEVGPVSYYGALKEPFDSVNVSSNRSVSAAKAKYIHSQNQHNINEVLKGLPHLQACSRGVLVTLEGNQDNVGTKPEGSKKLKNGQTVYFYSESQCKDQELVEYVKGIESY